MLNSILSEQMTAMEFIMCTGASVLAGIMCMLIFIYKNKGYTQSFAVTLMLLPLIVQVVIILVNGNVGTGLAVMGAFSLVRFRSIPGNAKEIGSIFLAMAMGLATGTGHLFIALITIVIAALVNIMIVAIKLGDSELNHKKIKITIPEDLDYTDVFDDIFEKYLTKFELDTVKTTNMGSLFQLTYDINFRKDVSEKAFIDEIRCRNGNLNVMCTRMAVENERM